MKILKVIPATKIPLGSPQILNYFAKESLSQGTLVLVNVKGQKIPALVFASYDIKKEKLAIKKAAFRLKPIDGILIKKAVFGPLFFDFLFWLSSYYWQPLGVFLKKALPKKFPLKISFEKRRETKDLSDFSASKFLVLESSDSLSLWRSLIKKGLKRGHVLFLFPEILKLEAVAQKLKKDFPLLRFHKSLRACQKNLAWEKAVSQKPFLFLSSRDGVFLPFRRLGLILLYEEASEVYKSWARQPKTNAKHISLILAKLHHCPLYFFSHAPSLETFWRWQKGNLKILKGGRPRQNFEIRERCSLKIIDVRPRERQEWSYLSKQVLKRTRSFLKKGEKVIFLQNRRGFATFIYCQDCGYLFQCSNCDFALNYHGALGKLFCHYCGYQETPPTICPKCRSHRIIYAGKGTEKLEKILEESFPQKGILRLDSDAAPTLKKKKEILDNFRKKSFQILISTTMILGEPVERVGAIFLPNVDLFLNFPSYRATEETFLLIQRLKGLAQELWLQTYHPNEPIFKALKRGSLIKFYKQELSLRKKFHYPPFTQLVKLSIKGKSNEAVRKKANLLAEKLERQKALLGKKFPVIGESDLLILGPAPAPLAKKQNYFWWQIILKIKRSQLKYRNSLLKIVGPEWDIDIDPIEV